MRPAILTTVDIPDIMNNVCNTYPGNLRHYYRVVFYKATNNGNGYHNWRHNMQVCWLFHDACRFYSDVEIDPETKRYGLIGSMFHDFNHSNKSGLGNDDLEVTAAIRGYEQNIDTTTSDAEPQNKERVANMIRRATQFPHTIPIEELSLTEQILREADVSQGLSPVWMQQILWGLGSEMSAPPIKMLRDQPQFYRNLHCVTEWWHNRFGQQVVDAKIREIEKHLEILE